GSKHRKLALVVRGTQKQRRFFCAPVDHQDCARLDDARQVVELVVLAERLLARALRGSLNECDQGVTELASRTFAMERPRFHASLSSEFGCCWCTYSVHQRGCIGSGRAIALIWSAFPVSSHRMSDMGIKPASVNSSMNCFVEYAEPSCFARSSSSSSNWIFPMM